MAVHNFRTGYVYGSRPFRSSLNRNKSYSVFDDDDPFWSDYNSLGSRYQTQLAPYLNYNYKLGLWDRVGNFFGFNTGEDRYRMQMQAKAKDALSGLLTDEFQNQFNSQQEQAQRMRDAGLNPDLAGEATGEQASGLEQPLEPIDPSIFDSPEKVIAPITNILGTAVSGLNGVGAFAKALSEIGLTKSQAANYDIKSLSDAWTAAGNWLSSLPPSGRIDFSKYDLTGTDADSEVLYPAVKEAALKEIEGMDSKAGKLFMRALENRYHDPAAMKTWWQNVAEATKAHNDKLVNEEVFGAIDAPDDFIKNNNKILFNYRVKTARYQFQADSILAQYNIQKYTNDFDFEKFKTDHKLPDNLGEANLRSFLATQAQMQTAKAKAEAELGMLNMLKEKSDSGDRASTYLLHGYLNSNGYAPLMNNTFGIGLQGVNGSIQRMITPDTFDNPADELLDQIGNVKANIRNKWFKGL